MINKLKQHILNPWMQLLYIVILLSCYWSWGILFTSHEEYTEPTIMINEESIPVDTVITYDQHQMIQIPESIDLPSDLMLPPQETITLDSASSDSLIAYVPESYQDSESGSGELRRSSEGVGSDQEDSVPLELKYKFWDMILGHLSSILGSLVALAIPAYNFWKKK